MLSTKCGGQATYAVRGDSVRRRHATRGWAAWWSGKGCSAGCRVATIGNVGVGIAAHCQREHNSTVSGDAAPHTRAYRTASTGRSVRDGADDAARTGLTRGKNLPLAKSGEARTRATVHLAAASVGNHPAFVARAPALIGEECMRDAEVEACRPRR